jgi:hypothetical protein
VKQRFLSSFLPLLLSGLLLGLGGCSLYHKVVHPYRLPTPKPSKQFIAQQKAEKKAKEAREKEAQANSGQKPGLFGGLFGGGKKQQQDRDVNGVPEAATDVSTRSGAPMPSGPKAASVAGTLPERSTVRYDKHQLMKKPKLNRRKIHKQYKGFHPIDFIRNFFKFGLHAKPDYSPDHRPAPKQPKSEPADAPARDAAPGGPPAAPDAGPGGPPAAPGAGPTGKP